MCHRDSNCGAQTCRRCESVVEEIVEGHQIATPQTSTYQAVYTAWNVALNNGDNNEAFALRALLREMNYQQGYR